MKTTYLVLGAMAIAAASVAPAAAKKAQPIVVSIDGFCNVETITLHTAKKGSVIIETGDSCDENFVMFHQPGRKLMLSFDKTALCDRAAKPRAQLRLWY